ncbi:MAG: NAD(P)H-dependent glycerol-3-phosphate dehydrogenase [Candidatus Competibacterales bacterium]
MAVAVLGAGAWGSALAVLLGRNGHPTALWSHRPATAATLAKDRENTRHLPGIPLPRAVTPTADLTAATAAAEVVLIAVPSQAFLEVLDRLVPLVEGTSLPIAWATKGLDPWGRLLHEAVADHLGPRPMAVVSGPSFADEVARGLPTALTVAANEEALAQRLARVFNGPTVRIFTTTDLLGVQLGGTFKNALAIAAGISDGLGFGANARAAVITGGLWELARLGEALGAKRDTLMGLSGVGDLVLTCTDDQSRNRRFGLAVGRGQNLAETRAQLGTVEGERTTHEVVQLAAKLGVALPIIERVDAVLKGRMSPREAVAALLAPPPRVEFPRPDTSTSGRAGGAAGD